MKYKEIAKEILGDRPKRDLVDDAFRFLKDIKQISSDYAFPYEQICCQLADSRLAIYRDEGLRIPSDSYECLYMVQSLILLQYIFGSGNVEKEHNGFMEYYKGLTTEQKQKLDPGLVYKHMFLDYFLPVFGADKTQEIFWIGRDMGMRNACFVVSFMNNCRYFDPETGKYKLKCLLCDKDGLNYELIARAKVDKEDLTEGLREGFIFFVCKDHYPLQAHKEFLEMAIRKLFPVKKLFSGDENVATD
jgi:hypothetical protein